MKHNIFYHIVPVIIGVFFCLFFVSCRQKTTEFRIGFSQCSNDEWRQKMNTEMQHEILLHSEVALEIKTVTDDTERQITDIQEFIDKKVDLIIVSPNKADPVTSVVEKAYAAGIPVVLVDRKISSDEYTAFIGADNYQIGKDVGNYIVKLLERKGNIVEIRGLDGSTPAAERHQGFYSIIDNYPEIKLLSSVDAAWLKDLAENKMEETLTAYPAIDAVYAHNDRMAIGAYNAAERMNRAEDIYFIGIDALPGNNGGIEQVLENKLKATFIYPTNGEKIIQLALNILQGKPYDKNNVLYTSVVDETNARVLKLQTDAIIEQESKIKFLDERVNSYMLQHATQQYLLLSAAAIVVLFIVFFVLLFRAYNSRNRLNVKLEKRNNEISEQKNLLEQQRDQLIILSKQLEEATHAKLVFFTNISHEFRTPLTLISGPVNSLLSDKTINTEQRRLLTLAQKNISVLLKLIDQIIDFRKYENGKMKLQPKPCDLKQQLVEWNESFREMAIKKRLHFKFDVLSDDDFVLMADMEKMERIYFNLMSNAFKFTPEKGDVSISLYKNSYNDGDFAVITVANTGKGISDEDIKHIFDRFYQVDSHHAGSGIGLALVKALVELHDGKIRVSSEINGWTTFTIQLPFLSNHMANENTSLPRYEIAQLPIMEDKIPTEQAEFFDKPCEENKYRILIVDDNPDIRSFVKIVFSDDHYKVYEAADGEEGFRKAVKHTPDIVISDIMMPNIDGIEFCKKLKEEISTSHIPVILLTACSLDEQRINGFQSGADDYISKPFNSDVLVVRVANLIESRKHLKELFRESLFSANAQENATNMEKTFLGTLRELIEKNLSDSELKVEDLGQNIGLSHTQLYRKVKSLTNLSPNELLRIMRLKEAYRLLSTTESNVSEIAYKVGFTSPSYFAKCFKDYYNESPTEFLKKLR